VAFRGVNDPPLIRKYHGVKRHRSIGARLTESEYQRVLLAADTVSPSEWVRAVLLDRLDRAPVEQRLMEELWALRHIFVNILPELVQSDAQRDRLKAAFRVVRDETEAKKAEKALAILKGER
jgi:hypothetical protein